MKPAIKISQTVIKRLSKTKNICLGKLYGIFFKNTLTVIGLQVDVASGINLVYSYPAEVDFCGIFEVSDGHINQPRIKEYVHDIDVTDNPVFISCTILQAKSEIDVNIIVNEQIEKTCYDIISEQDIYSQFVHIRLKGEIPIKCEVTTKAIEDTFHNIRKNLSSGVIGFTFPKTSVFLLENESENSVVGIVGDPYIGYLCEKSNGVSEGGNRKKKTETFELEILNIDMLKRVTKDDQNGIAKQHAPLYILNKKQVKVLNTLAVIDSLAMIHVQTKVANLYEILLESAIRYLILFEKNLINHLCAKDNADDISFLQPFHFYSSECGHFLTRLYPKSETEESIKNQRRLLHKQLMLDIAMPIFRRANQYSFKNENKVGGPLINPHEGIKPTDNGGQISVIKGKYEYYHYGQNRMDDNGWGCAYRSLQTLASWFKLQGFTDKEVPTFKDIQKCLVDIGDKPSSFIDSKQWIGSTEVNFVLSTLLGITSKILYVSSGEEMSTKGPELLNHFERHGSPVMIGGGVLAHTILGVDYNQQTGNLKFLILDPHYTGAEDLHIIQNKNWCGWKNVDFWDKSAYYNMCLPQVPREI